eukprot:CAMPEP_0206429270 /NCGR_PEP_ID=MMETSP0324_2-20121206/6137_1 /ASSEMBLY_ACC=CAM_ASM_000836 /TAXON_ID=2866 /ORGANISM="Crypthecodinium cohnii, Strain Seligo" /LENGTH=104 /DNA_ID=CAMNT_0053894911 /DNA_START=266 /DNA_END=580 /DNA_ORIENTATION=-
MGRDVRSGLFDSVAPVNMLEGEQNILCLCPCCASDVVPRVEFTGLRASDDSRRLAWPANTAPTNPSWIVAPAAARLLTQSGILPTPKRWQKSSQKEQQLCLRRS